MPNVLTYGRVAAVPVVAGGLLSTDADWMRWSALAVFILAGLGAGGGALLTWGRVGAGSPTFGELAELDSIAAVVIGGASFLGGRGHVGHALVGALMIGVIRNGMNLLDIEAYIQLIVIGVVIVVAVESDVVRSRLEERFRVLRAAAR